eukprot:6212826-Pleurochrysis_carterae.AAC.2
MFDRTACSLPEKSSASSGPDACYAGLAHRCEDEEGPRLAACTAAPSFDSDGAVAAQSRTARHLAGVMVPRRRRAVLRCAARMGPVTSSVRGA